MYCLKNKIFKNQLTKSKINKSELAAYFLSIEGNKILN